MSNMAEKVYITRRAGRLHKVEVLSAEGMVLCELPLIGVSTDERVRPEDDTEVSLVVSGRRVMFGDQVYEREPNVVELPRPDLEALNVVVRGQPITLQGCSPGASPRLVGTAAARRIGEEFNAESWEVRDATGAVVTERVPTHPQPIYIDLRPGRGG